MNPRLFLTSIIAMGIVTPAVAVPTYTGEFPQDGLMEADYTYTDAATSTNMAGVYEGSVTAEAQYTDNLYQLVAGEYLPANSETPITCDQNGYFCPGDSNGVYYQNYNQGLTQCPTGYGNTANGASANTDCYRTCSGNVAISHASGVTGNDYYGNGTDTCEPTGCVNGWHIKAGVPDLAALVGVTEIADGMGYVSNDGTRYENIDTYGLSTVSDQGKFIVDFGSKGRLTGHAQCSTQEGTNGWNGTSTTLSTLPDSSGIHCWCKIDGYTPYGGNLRSFPAPWVYAYSNALPQDCTNDCAFGCSYNIFIDSPGSLAFRSGIFNANTPALASCEANVITINWGDTDLADVIANEAGTATYGSDIRTPVKAQTKPGKTFTGWSFVAPEQASVEEP